MTIRRIRRFRPSLASLVAGAALLFVATTAHAAPYVLRAVWNGEAVGDQFGIAIAPGGDLDGDGYPDLLVGANVNDAGGRSAGRAYVFPGAATLPSTWSATYTGAVERGYAGQAVAGGADLDGDGYPDWVVGAPGPGPDGDYPGQVFVFRGGPGADAVPDLVLTGVVPGGQFGHAVCLPGDLDGNGACDLAVGAPRAGGGAVYLYRGGAALDTIPDAVLHAGPDDQRLGFCLVGMPDRDGDGRDELLIGVPMSSRTVAWAGAVLLLAGSADLDTVPDQVWTGATAGEEFGYALAVGDADGDDVPDLLVGAPFANPGDVVDAGRADLFPSLGPVATLAVTGTAQGEHLGLAVAAGFDWDGDGSGDLAVAAPEAVTGAGTDAGRVDVLRGGTFLDAAPDTQITGNHAGLHLGTALAAGGDLGGNGRGTLCVGGYNTVNNGTVWVFGSGEPSLVAVPELPADPVVLGAPWPNPANPAVACRLEVGRDGPWRVTVHDLAGRLVAVLHDGFLPAGTVVLRWDGRARDGTAAAAGAYLLRVAGGGTVVSRPLAIAR